MESYQERGSVFVAFALNLCAHAGSPGIGTNWIVFLLAVEFPYWNLPLQHLFLKCLLRISTVALRD